MADFFAAGLVDPGECQRYLFSQQWAKQAKAEQ
jgi:hypothetical protein